MQTILLFNKSILPRQLLLKMLPELQQAGLSQLNSQSLAKGRKQVAGFFSISLKIT